MAVNRSAYGHEPEAFGFAKIFGIFLLLGCTSFGGPVAHIGFFREAFVAQRKWLDDATFSTYLALCQFIPGPASSQLGMAVGYHHAGYSGALAAWLGFTLPSALLLAGFALVLVSHPDWLAKGVTQGLKLVALAVVVQAFLAMRTTLAPDRSRIVIMLTCAGIFLVWRSNYAPIAVLCFVGVMCALARSFGVFRLKVSTLDGARQSAHSGSFGKRISIVMLSLFLTILLFDVLLSDLLPHTDLLDQFLAYYRSGALVFGGGHVVLPLLESEIVGAGWVDKEIFLTGYGAAQAVPGPLFTFASFLGASHESGVGGAEGAILATIAIFLPSFLLLFGVLPFWASVQKHIWLQGALWGVNAAVLGLLLATIYDPIITNTLTHLAEAVLAILAFVALYFWRLPLVLVVFSGALAGGLFL